MSKIIHITDDQFEAEVLKSTTPVLVDFWATWCGPCRQVGSILDELSEEMPEVKFVKIDIDKNSVYSGKLGIMSIPTMIIYKNGEITGKQIGALSKKDLKGFIESYI